MIGIMEWIKITHLQILMFSLILQYQKMYQRFAPVLFSDFVRLS